MPKVLSPVYLRQFGTTGAAQGQLRIRTNPRSQRHTSKMVRVSRLLTAGAILWVAALLLDGCSNASTGSVRGVFDGLGNQVTRVGGVPSAGKIVLSNPNGTYQATVGRDGKFSFSVPPGNYRIVGRSPGQSGGVSSCTGSVRVEAGEVTRTVVTCVFH
jgi:hypothetical protein